jgi:adenosylcobinamide-phosphate synthase
MIPLEYKLLAAFLLDLLLGDPRWFPHPVRLIGGLAQKLEPLTRAVFPWAKVAGIVTALTVIGAAGFCAWGIVYLAGMVNPLAGDVASILILYTTLSTRDLIRHSTNVYQSLAEENIEEARRRVSMIVGRDTKDLDEKNITRAVVETVAENTVDGVTAPLFFALLAGPVGAMVYKAINTLDSTFGYKNERYIDFGWASARIDDLANLIPARLTAPIICLGACLLRLRPQNAWRIYRRDARNHSSPNSGFAESAVAGALGIQVGGLNYYFGKPMEKPTIGDPLVELNKTHILQVNRLMLTSVTLFLVLGIVTRFLWRMH